MQNFLETVISQGWKAGIPLAVTILITLLTQLFSTNYEKLFFTPRTKLLTFIARVLILSCTGVFLVIVLSVSLKGENDFTSLSDLIIVFLIYLLAMTPTTMFVQKFFRDQFYVIENGRRLYIQKVTLDSKLLLTTTASLNDEDAIFVTRPLNYPDSQEVYILKWKLKNLFRRNRIPTTENAEQSNNATAD